MSRPDELWRQTVERNGWPVDPAAPFAVFETLEHLGDPSRLTRVDAAVLMLATEQALRALQASLGETFATVAVRADLEEAMKRISDRRAGIEEATQPLAKAARKAASLVQEQARNADSLALAEALESECKALEGAVKTGEAWTKRIEALSAQRDRLREALTRSPAAKAMAAIAEDAAALITLRKEEIAELSEGAAASLTALERLELDHAEARRDAEAARRSLEAFLARNARAEEEIAAHQAHVRANTAVARTLGRDGQEPVQRLAEIEGELRRIDEALRLALDARSPALEPITITGTPLR